VLAVTAAGKKPAASRLIGYQMLRWLSSPYSIASTAMATEPARPPLDAGRDRIDLERQAGAGNSPGIGSGLDGTL